MTKIYLSYLLRIWQDEDSMNKNRFASLEEPSTKKMIHFKTLDELFEFLNKQSNANEEDILLPKIN